MNDKLNHYKNEYRNILEKFKNDSLDIAIGRLMTKMENEFNIPLINDESYNKSNPEIVSFYRELSKARNI